MNNTQHWPILQQLELDFLVKIRLFMVIGKKGDGVVVTTRDGKTFWFGWIGFGEESKQQAKEPTKINVNGTVTSMAHGNTHIVLLTSQGQCWVIYEKNWHCISNPLLVPSNVKFSSIQCGSMHCVALGEDQKVYCWEQNKPDNLSEFCLEQVLDLDSHQIVAIACGGSHSLALTALGEVYGWYTSISGTPNPIKISIKHCSIKSIVCCRSRSLMLSHNGQVYSCKLNRQSTYNPLKLNTLVTGLPTITQIAAHFRTNVWTAMSDDHSVYVLGQFEGMIDISTPIKFNLTCIFAPFAMLTSQPSIAYSIQATPPNRLPLRLSAMFDNPATSDIQFEVEQKTIHAHRYLLQSLSGYFNKLLSETWLPTKPNEPLRPIVIEGYSYSVFYAYLLFLYTGKFQVSQENLLEFFDLASCYLEEELRQLLLDKLRLSITAQNCSVYYEFIVCHQVPEFEQFVVKFISDHIFQVYGTETYRAMKPELCKKLTIAIGDLKLQKKI